MFASIWRQRGVVACLLFPISLCFRLLAWLRRALYSRGVLPSYRLPVPVVVVGNITVGGAGKTPLILHLADALRERGRRPGIVSRGYGGAAGQPQGVTAQSQAQEVGDEPVLLAQRSGCPVFVGRDRVAAAQALLAAHPECDLILADDGLQHYRMRRDVEIAVLDARGLQNGWLLPAGPLREPLGRLAEVDAVVANGEVGVTWRGDAPRFQMRLQGARFYRLDAPQQTCSAAELQRPGLHAVAGIGDPQRFFAHLAELGLRFEPHPFPDHHDYTRQDLDIDAAAILTTEKDAVKLRAISSQLPGCPVWVLPVTATITPDLTEFILGKLNGCPPA